MTCLSSRGKQINNLILQILSEFAGICQIEFTANLENVGHVNVTKIIWFNVEKSDVQTQLKFYEHTPLAMLSCLQI